MVQERLCQTGAGEPQTPNSPGCPGLFSLPRVLSMTDECPSISLWKLMLNLSLSCLYPCLWSALTISTDTEAEPLAHGTSRAKLRKNLPLLLLEASASCLPTLGVGEAPPPMDGLHLAVAPLSRSTVPSFSYALEQSHLLWSWGHMYVLDSPQHPPHPYLEIHAYWYSAIIYQHCSYQKRTSYPTKK